MFKYIHWLLYGELSKENKLPKEGRYEKRYIDFKTFSICLRTKYYKYGILHREDGPSYYDSCEKVNKWYIHGYLHREDGPAVHGIDYKMWYFYNLLHREDGPAIETRRASEWYIHGELHREDGPAYIDNGISIWYKNGAPHREKGAAVLTEGKCIISKTNKPVDLGCNLKIIDVKYARLRATIENYNLAEEDMYLITHKKIRGEIFFKDGVLHREDGPAVICSYEDKIIAEMWYKDGILQKESGTLVV